MSIKLLRTIMFVALPIITLSSANAELPKCSDVLKTCIEHKNHCHTLTNKKAKEECIWLNQKGVQDMKSLCHMSCGITKEQNACSGDCMLPHEGSQKAPSK